MEQLIQKLLLSKSYNRVLKVQYLCLLNHLIYGMRLNIFCHDFRMR